MRVDARATRGRALTSLVSIDNPGATASSLPLLPRERRCNVPAPQARAAGGRLSLCGSRPAIMAGAPTPLGCAGCGQRNCARRKPSRSPQGEAPIATAVAAIIWPRLVVAEATSDRFVLSSVPASIPHEASERDEPCLRSSSSLRWGLPVAGAALCRCGSAASWVASISSRFLSGHRPAKRATLR